MNIFKESVEGIIKAVKEDAVNNAGFNSTTTSNYRAYIYENSGLYLTVAGNQAADADIKISGSIDDGKGTVMVTSDSDIVLAIRITSYNVCYTKLLRRKCRHCCSGSRPWPRDRGSGLGEPDRAMPIGS